MKDRDEHMTLTRFFAASAITAGVLLPYYADELTESAAQTFDAPEIATALDDGEILSGNFKKGALGLFLAFIGAGFYSVQSRKEMQKIIEDSALRDMADSLESIKDRLDDIEENTAGLPDELEDMADSLADQAKAQWATERRVGTVAVELQELGILVREEEKKQPFPEAPAPHSV